MQYQKHLIKTGQYKEAISTEPSTSVRVPWLGRRGNESLHLDEVEWDEHLKVSIAAETTFAQRNAETCKFKI